MTTAEDVIALDKGWSQQVTSFRFDLLDKEGVHLGDVPVFYGATVDNNINRTIKRALNGVTVPPDVVREVDLLSVRLSPVMLFTDGSEYPLGTFLFTDTSITRITQGSAQFTDPNSDVGVAAVTLLDQMVLLDVGSPSPISFRPGTLVVDAITNLFERVAQWSPGITWELPDSDAVIGGAEWFVKAPGTTILAAMNDLCSLASFYSVYADNAGVFKIKVVPDIDGDPEFYYDHGSTVIEESIVESTDLFNIPNRYIVINSALTEKVVYGSWDIPSSSDYSIAARGRVISKVVDRQGINSNAQAQKTAKALATAGDSAYEWVDFDATPNPLHDTFNLVNWEGNNYREQSWSLALVAGGPHHHELRRTYTPDNDDPLDEFIEDPDEP